MVAEQCPLQPVLIHFDVCLTIITLSAPHFSATSYCEFQFLSSRWDIPQSYWVLLSARRTVTDFFFRCVVRIVLDIPRLSFHCRRIFNFLYMPGVTDMIFIASDLCHLCSYDVKFASLITLFKTLSLADFLITGTHSDQVSNCRHLVSLLFLMRTRSLDVRKFRSHSRAWPT